MTARTRQPRLRRETVAAGPGTQVTGVEAPRRAALPIHPRPFIFQNLRRNVCPHFFLTGPQGAIPVHAPHLLKGLIRQPQNTSRCQLRAGVHLEEGYVLDVCLSARFNQCVFYEDDLASLDERRR